MVHSHKVVSSPATCGSEARPDGAGRLPLRAIKIVVWNVGGMAAAADFIIACKSDGMIDILVLVEAKVQDLDRARALIELMFPGAGIQIVGVPCERNLDVAAGMLRQNVYGGIVAVIFNRGIHAQPRSPRDGVVAFECTTRGMRPIDIIAVYLPPRPDAGKDQRRFLSAGQRLEHMVLEYNAARRKQHRVIIVGDFNAHIGNCDGHFCVRKDVSPIEQRLQLLDAFSACGVSPLHGRLKDAPAYPTSYSQQHTVDGVKLARREGRHPGAESDYIAGDVLWLEGREFTLFARNDLTVPYFGGPLPVNEQYHPKGPPRHDLLAANITLEEEQQPQAEAPAQRQKQQKVAAYGDGGAWPGVATGGTGPRCVADERPCPSRRWQLGHAGSNGLVCRWLHSRHERRDGRSGGALTRLPTRARTAAAVPGQPLRASTGSCPRRSQVAAARQSAPHGPTAPR